MNAFRAVEWLFTETVVERLGWVLVHSLWQFALVALLAGVIVRTMRRSSAATRYGLMAVAMAVSVTAPVATWMLQPSDAPPDHSVNRGALAPGHDANAAISQEADATRLASVPILASDPEREVPTPDHAVPSAASEALPVVSPSVPAIVQSAPSWSERATTVLRPWLAWIVVGWSLGVVMCSLRPLLGWHTLWRLQRVGVSPASDEVLSMMRRVSERLGLRYAVRVLQSTLTHVPVVIGYMRPVILLPVSLATSIPAAQLEAILAHELAHVQRHDFVVNLLQTLVETVFFYHPAVWWLSHQIRIEREHCCDDLVVKLLGNRVEYGRALVAIEELRGRSTVLALGAADGSLLSRVRRIIRGGSDREADSQLAAVRLRDRWPFALLSIAFVGLALVLSLSWTLAAKDDAAKEPQPTIAKLRGDVTVELIGVGFHPSKDREWWKADGSKLEQPPTLKSRFGVIPNARERDQIREFVIQIRGLSNESSAITIFEGSNASTYSLADGLWVGESRAGPFKSKTTSIRVGLTSEPYGPIASINATGEKQAVPKMPEELQKFYALIAPLGVKEIAGKIDGQTELLLAGIPYEALHKSAVWEMHAIDVDGKKHRSSSESASATGERHVAFKLPLSRITRFEYRLRPYRHWVTFENVSLQSGLKTDVKISIDSLPPTDAEAIANQFLVAIKGQKLPFLNDAKQEALRKELQDAIAPHVSKPLSKERREKLVAATALFVEREFDPFEKDALYLDFPNRFATLKWKLRIALSRSEPTPEQVAQLAAQRKWMRDRIEEEPESKNADTRREDKHAKLVAQELANLEALFDDPLNPFFQELMSDADFKRFQTKFTEDMDRDRSGTRLSFASPRLLESAIDVLADTLLQRWPVKNAGWHRQWLRWTLVVTRQAGNESLALADVNTKVRHLYADVVQNIFVPDEPPAALAARADWLQQKGQGDLAFDAKLDSLIGVRGAKLAVLSATDWFSADQVPPADLQTLIKTDGKDAIPLSLFIEADANGIKRRRAIAPSLVIQTQEGRISVIRIRDVAGDDPIIMSRPRPLPVTQPVIGRDPGSRGHNSVMSWSSDSKQLFTQGGLLRLMRWERSGTELKHTDSAIPEGGDNGWFAHAYSIAVSNKSGLIALGTNVGTVQFWDGDSLTFQKQIVVEPDKKFRGATYGVAISPDEKLLAEYGVSAHLYEIATMKRVCEFGKRENNRTSSLAFAPDGRTLAALNWEGELTLWSIPDGTLIAEWSLKNVGEKSTVQWSRDGDLVAVVNEGHIAFVTPTAGSVPRLVVAPDEVCLMTPKNLLKGNHRRRIGLPDGIDFAGVMALAPDFKSVASVKIDSSVALWDVETRTVLSNLAPPLNDIHVEHPGLYLKRLMFSPNGRQLACKGDDGNVVVWTLTDAGIATVGGEPGKESEASVKVDSPPGEPLRLRVKDARGAQARFNSVAVATVGFPKAPPDIDVKLDRKADVVRQLPKSVSDVWPRSPNREGIVSLDGLPVGTHWLLAAGDSPERLPFLVTIPTEQPLMERRLRHPAWMGKKVELAVQPVVEVDGKEGEVIVIEILNRSNEALSFSEEDLILLCELPNETIRGREWLRGLSPKWLTADREPFPQTKIEAGQTGRMRLNWREWVRQGLWSSRNHETITEPGFPPNEPGKIWVKAGLGNGGSLPVSVTDPKEVREATKPDGLRVANRPSYAGLSLDAGFNRFRLQGFPIAGDSIHPVAYLDSLASHLPEDVRLNAGRRFHEGQRAIYGPSAQMPSEESMNCIINDSRDLPPIYRAALMCNLWIFANDWMSNENTRSLYGPDILFFDRIKNKCAIVALEQAEEIPVGLTLRFLEKSTGSLSSLSADDDPKFSAQRQLRAELWLTLIEKVRAVVDPDWDSNYVPMLNPDVSRLDAVGNPQQRADYTARVEAHRHKNEQHNQQLQVRRLLADLSPRMEEDLIRLYIRKPFVPAELDSLLDKHAADKFQRDRIAKSVRLVNAILPNGTRLKYGWPDSLAEAGPSGVAALMAAVRDKSYPHFIRNDGAWALGLIGDPRAIDTLTAVAEDESTPDKYKDIAREFVRVFKESAEATRKTAVEVDPVKELASLQGTWCFDVLQFRVWPEPIGIGTDSDGRNSEKRWLVTGNQITWISQEGERIYVNFAIDPTKTPKQIDFTFVNGPHRGAKSLGIYEPQKGNANYLWLCMTNPGSNAPRPIDVSYSSEKQQSMIGIYPVALPEKPSVAKGLERFQGDWQMTLCDSTLRTFGATQQEASKWQWSIKGDEILWSRQSEVWKLKLDVDPSKRPREMDLTYLTGPFKNEKCLGMYEFGGVDGQSLMISIQDPGSTAPRPTSISMRGDVKTGLIFLRPSKPSDTERQIGAFQGTWTLKNIVTGSWPIPSGKGPDKSGEGSELRWVVKGNELTWTSRSGEEIKASFTIDSMKRPKQIDLTFLSGPNKGETCPGIYQRGDLDENILWLCLADLGSKSDRPKKFSYEREQGRSLISLYRFNPDDPSHAEPTAKVEPSPVPSKGLPKAKSVDEQTPKPNSLTPQPNAPDPFDDRSGNAAPQNAQTPKAPIGGKGKTGGLVVRVVGRIVDDETGEPINNVAWQYAQVVPGSKETTWEVRLAHPLKDGKFDEILHEATNYQRRVMAAGYEPASLLDEPPNPLPDPPVIERTIRLKKGRLITGVLRDHLGQTVANAKVFFVPKGHRAKLTEGFPGWRHQFPGPPGSPPNMLRDNTVSEDLTNDKGEFEFHAAGAGTLAASTDFVDLWPFDLPKVGQPAELQMPKPATLTIDLSYWYLRSTLMDSEGPDDKKRAKPFTPDIESAEQCWISAERIRTGQPIADNRWDAIDYSRQMLIYMAVPANTKYAKGVSIDENHGSYARENIDGHFRNTGVQSKISILMPPGKYVIGRYRTGDVVEVELKAGEEARLDWKRGEGAAVRGTVKLPAWSVVIGPRVTIKSADGKVRERAIIKDGTFFVATHLEPGRYTVLATADLPPIGILQRFTPPTHNGPDLEAQQELVIPEVVRGPAGPPPVRVELTMKSNDKRVVPPGAAEVKAAADAPAPKPKAPLDDWTDSNRDDPLKPPSKKLLSQDVPRAESGYPVVKQNAEGELLPDGWIPCEFGLQYRVLTYTPRLAAGELPLLFVDVRNRGTFKDMGLELHQSRHVLVVDGKPYERRDQPWAGVTPLEPEGKPLRLAFALSDDWKREDETKTPLRLAHGTHQIAVSVVIAPVFPPQTDEPQTVPQRTPIRRSLVCLPIQFEVRLGAWGGPPGSLGLENIRRELIAMADFHAPTVPANLQRLVQEHQPAAGDELIKLLKSNDSSTALQQAPSVVFADAWDSMSREQIERYLLVTMTHFVGRRSQYPQGVDASIGMGTRHRPGYLGLPTDRKYSAETVTTHYVDGQQIDKPYSYPGLGAQTHWIKTKDLSLGRHTFRLATKYTFTRGDETYRGSYESSEFAFEMVPANTPDDLIASKDEQLDRLVHEALRIGETEKDLRHPPGEDGSSSGRIVLPDNNPWHPQITWGANKLGVASLHAPVWKLAKRLPVDLCFSVEFRIENTDTVIRCYDLVALADHEGQGYFSTLNFDQLADFLKHADKEGFVSGRLVLKPSRSVALTETKVKRYYNGEITSQPLRFKISTMRGPDKPQEQKVGAEKNNEEPKPKPDVKQLESEKAELPTKPVAVGLSTREQTNKLATAIGSVLKATSTMEKSEVMVGEPTWIKFKVTNPTDKKLMLVIEGDYRHRIPDPISATIAESFAIELRDERGNVVPQPVPPLYSQGGGVIRPGLELPAKGEALVELFLPLWVTITRPGKYDVAIRCQCEIHPNDDPDGFRKAEMIELASETTLNVIPPNVEKFGEVIEQLGQKLLAFNSREAADEAYRAHRTMKLIRDERVVAWYVKLLEQPNQTQKFHACDGLAPYGSGTALSALKRAMKLTGDDFNDVSTSKLADDLADNVRCCAAHALTTNPNPQAAAFLLTQATDRSDSVRLIVLQFAARLKTKEAIELVGRMTKDKNKSVRDEAKLLQKKLRTDAGQQNADAPTNPQKDVFHGDEDPLPEIVRPLLLSVVTVAQTNSKKREVRPRWQSGIIVDDRGYILTMQLHDDIDHDRITVKLADQSEFPAEVVATDPSLRLAVLCIQPPRPISAVSVSKAVAVKEGDAVFAVPSPAQKVARPDFVKAIGKSLGDDFPPNLIHSGLSLPLGEGGSLMTTKTGEPVGIWFAIRSGGSASFAIPLKDALPLLAKSVPQPAGRAAAINPNGEVIDR